MAPKMTETVHFYSAATYANAAHEDHETLKIRL